jgi:hypothetical protein
METISDSQLSAPFRDLEMSISVSWYLTKQRVTCVGCDVETLELGQIPRGFLAVSSDFHPKNSSRLEKVRAESRVRRIVDNRKLER